MTTDAFVGGGMDALTASDGGVFESTLADTFDPVFCDCSIKAGAVTTTTSYAESSHANLTAYWVRFDLYATGSAITTERTLVSFYNSGGTEVFRLSGSPAPSSLSIRAYSWNGAAFVAIGTAFAIPSSTRTTLVMNLVAGTGAYAMYASGSLRDSGTGSTFSNIAKERFRGAFVECYYSQIRAADYSLIGTNLKTIVPDTASATNTAWTGTYTEVDEVVYSDADFIYSTSNGDVETYTKSGLDLSAYVVQGLAVSARANCGATGPQNLQLALRTSATNYVSASVLQGAGYAVSQNIWATNPNTSAAWASAAAQAAEFGVKAIT